LEKLEIKPNYMTVPAAIRELEKIEKAQDAVEKTKARYDAAVQELRALLEKKDAQRKQELLKAVENSPRSFDEIMAF
jgi:Skp family chaperone for outer membrane proteins